MNRSEMLVLDDDPMLGEQLRALLEVLGHRAVYLSSAAKALRLLQETSFDVIFCDYWLPPKGGQDFYRRLSSVRPELPARLVFVVAGVLGDQTQMFIKRSGTPQLLKPFRLQAVERVLQEVLNPLLTGGDPALQEQR